MLQLLCEFFGQISDVKLGIILAFIYHHDQALNLTLDPSPETIRSALANASPRGE